LGTATGFVVVYAVVAMAGCKSGNTLLIGIDALCVLLGAALLSVIGFVATLVVKLALAM
jgi:hypothetical protein